MIGNFTFWATTVNYPAGVPAWQGTPTKLPPPGSGYFVPGVIYNAQHFNQVLNQFSSQDAQTVSALLANWQSAFSPGSTTVCGVAWNPAYRVWAHLKYSGGAFTTEFYTGQGSVLAAAGPSAQTTATAPSAVVCGSDGRVYAATVNASGGNGEVYHSLPTDAGWTALLGLGAVSNVFLTTLGSKWVVIATNTSGGTTQYVVGNSGTTSGDFSTTVASAPTSGGWAVATNGSTVVFITKTTAPFSYAGTATNVAGSGQLGSLLGGSDVPADVVWANDSTGNGRFVVSVVSGTSTKILTSPDGLTWALVNTISSFGTVLSGAVAMTTMKAIGSFVTGIASGGSSHFGYASFSLDGGINWYPGDQIFEVSGGASAFTPLLAAGDGQFAFGAGTQAQLQFSIKAGIPTNPLS